MNLVVICFSALLVVQIGSLVGKSTMAAPSNQQRVERAESHPDLEVTFNDVGQLKIAMRKTDYRIGEMITLDIALLNKSSRPLFFRSLSQVQINIRNSAGEQLAVQAYGVADRALVPGSFTRLPANEMVLRSFQLLVGCDKRAFAQVASTDVDALTLFSRGSFLSWGDACLPTQQPGTVTISAELKNDFVLFSSGRNRIKTAVGNIGSNSLTVRIAD